MDELDRMHKRLTQNVRTGFPDYLSRPFEIAELYQTLIPYRHNRRELELETNQDYEMALLRLLSGERGYLVGDAAMQEAMRRELASSNPDLSAFRAWATTEVRLAADGVRGDQPSPARGQVAAAPAADARPTDPLEVPVSAAGAAMPPTPLPPAGVSPPSLTLGTAPMAAGELPQRPPSPVVANGGSCRFCGGTLPEGRRVTFCPHCGQNLTVRHCPACGTELEVGWRFCTTCGREVGTG